MGNKGQEHCQTAFPCTGMLFLGGALFPQHCLIATNIEVRLGGFQHPELSVYTDLENP